MLNQAPCVRGIAGEDQYSFVPRGADHPYQQQVHATGGQDDIFFTREGGKSYLKGLPNAEMRLLVATSRLSAGASPLKKPKERVFDVFP